MLRLPVRLVSSKPTGFEETGLTVGAARPLLTINNEICFDVVTESSCSTHSQLQHAQQCIVQTLALECNNALYSTLSSARLQMNAVLWHRCQQTRLHRQGQVILYCWHNTAAPTTHSHELALQAA
jgi:hypothetical protein